MRKLHIFCLLAMAKIITVLFVCCSVVCLIFLKFFSIRHYTNINLSGIFSISEWKKIIGNTIKAFVSPYVVSGFTFPKNNNYKYAYIEDGKCFCLDFDTAVEIKMRYGGDITKRTWLAA